MLNLLQGCSCAASGWRTETGGLQGPCPYRAQDNCEGTASANPRVTGKGSLKGCCCWSMGTGVSTGCLGFCSATGGCLPRRSIPDSFAEDSDGHL